MHVDVEYTLPLRFIKFGQPNLSSDARVVDEHIEATEVAQARIEQLLDRSSVRDVGRDREGLTTRLADRLGRFLELGHGATGDDDGDASPREILGDRPSQTSPTAGHHSHSIRHGVTLSDLLQLVNSVHVFPTESCARDAHPGVKNFGEPCGLALLDIEVRGGTDEHRATVRTSERHAEGHHARVDFVEDLAAFP